MNEDTYLKIWIKLESDIDLFLKESIDLLYEKDFIILFSQLDKIKKVAEQAKEEDVNPLVFLHVYGAAFLAMMRTLNKSVAEE